MGNEHKKCDICDEDYTSAEGRKPVMITLCGHTYCRSCVCQLEEAGKKACPSCRVDWSKLKAQELPVCFQLLPEEDEENQDDEKIKADVEKRKREDERLALKQRLEREEKTLSEMRDKNRDSLDDVGKRISAVREFMEMIPSHLVSLEAYQSELSDFEKILEQKLQQLQNDLQALSEAQNEPYTGKEIVEFVPQSSVELVSPKAPVSKICAVSKAYLASRSYSDDARFVQTFYNSLKVHCAEMTNANFPKAPSAFADCGSWTVSNSASAREANRLLTHTSARPTSVSIVVDESPCDVESIITFSRTVSSKECYLTLSFNDSFNFPSPEKAAENTRILASLLESSRRVTVSEYKGCIDNEVANQLSGLNVLQVTLKVTSKEEMVAANGIGIVNTWNLHIKDGTNVTAALHEVPNTGFVCLHFSRRTDEDLFQMVPALPSLNNREQNTSINLLDSRITEAGLDRFLGQLRDVGVLLTYYSRYYSLTFVIQSHAIDTAGQQRITERLKSWNSSRRFISWA